MKLFDKFPSFQQLQTAVVATFRRFPLTLLSAVVGTVAGVLLVEYHDDLGGQSLEKLLMVAALGLPLFTALTLLVEKRKWRMQTAFAVQLAGVLLLVAYYFSLPDHVMETALHSIRFVLLGLGLHFLVACLPYIGGNQTNGFWQYNMSLFYRFLMAAVYSSVLYIGLTIALAAADHLFGLTVEDERYFQLWIIMAGVFNTWMFLAGIPRDLEALEHATDSPKGIAVFAQYLLLPLVTLYFVILISYEAKIIITWNWPKGWVSELVLWFSAVGILSLLSLYPLRKQEGKRWVRTFVRWFFRALIPLTGLLFLAILRRISEYGITEPRYLVLAMAIGLAVVTLYFLISKAKDIRIIPILLSAAALLAAYGPWSASAVSLTSQRDRLDQLLTQNGILKNGSLQEAGHDISSEDRQNMSSIIDYVCEWHGTEPFSKWLGEGAIDSLDSDAKSSPSHEIAELFGFEYTRSRGAGPGFSISGGGAIAGASSVAITGFDYLIDFRLVGNNDFRCAIPLGADSCFVSLDTSALVLNVGFGQDRDSSEGGIRFELSDALDSIVATYGNDEVPVSDRTFVLSGDSHEVKLVLRHVRGAKESDVIRVRVFEGHLLVHRRLQVD